MGIILINYSLQHVVKQLLAVYAPLNVTLELSEQRLKATIPE